MKTNHLIEEKKTIIVNGVGATLNEAIDNGLKDMRNQLQTMITEPILSISAEAIECKKFDETVEDEAFLYFFFKRKKKTYYTELEIQISVKYLQIGGAFNV